MLAMNIADDMAVTPQTRWRGADYFVSQLKLHAQQRDRRPFVLIARLVLKLL